MLKASGKYVLIEVIKDEAKEGDYLLPEDVAEKPSKGIIIDGMDAEDIGVTIRFKRYAGQEFREEGKDLAFIKEDDVMGYYAKES